MEHISQEALKKSPYTDSNAFVSFNAKKSMGTYIIGR
jgi:hypothetical protein